MRKFAKSFIFKIFAYILIAAFALTGVSAGFMADLSDNYLVKVGDEKIYQHHIEKKYDRIIRNLLSRGVDFSEEQLAAMGISRIQVLQTTIQEKLMQKAVDEAGLSIGNAHIKKMIATSPAFQKDGKFDTELFNLHLYQEGMREDDYVNVLRDELAINMLMGVVLNNNTLNDKIKEARIKELSESRTIRTVNIPANKKKFKGEITDKELVDFYFENSFMFEVPEKRSASYILFDNKAGQEAETYEIITNVEDELAGGSTLEEIASKFPVKLQKAEMVSENNSSLDPILLQNIFTLEDGEPSTVIENGDTYLVVNVDEIKESYIPELGEVKKQVVAAYKKEMDKLETRQFAKTIHDSIKEHGDYRAIARKNRLTTKKHENIVANEIAQINFELYQDSFDAKIKEVIGVYENSDGSFDIGILEDIEQKEVSEIEAAKYENQIIGELESEIVSQYLASLQQKYSVEYNPNFEM